MGVAGRKVSVRFCAAFTFTEDDRIKSEIAYYDRLTTLEQLGFGRFVALRAGCLKTIGYSAEGFE
jgi:hypothetical protein